jgi:hypothetical protein
MFNVEMEMLPDVDPNSELGRAYARWQQLRRDVRDLQQELAQLSSEQAESLRAFHLAINRDRDARGLVDPIAERGQRITEIEEQLRPLLADVRLAEETFGGLYRQYAQAKTAIATIRGLAG